jgi:hypothetical protein
LKIPDKLLINSRIITEEIKMRFEKTLARMTLPQTGHVGLEDELFPLL